MARLACLAVLALVLAGCGAAKGGLPEGAVAVYPEAAAEVYPPLTFPAPLTAAALDGRTFLLDEVTVDGRPRPLIGGQPIVLVFPGDGKMGAEAGCNGVGTDYRIDDGRLTPGALTQTAQGCSPEELYAQDELIVALLSASPAIELRGSEIELRGAGIVARGRQAAPAP